MDQFLKRLGNWGADVQGAMQRLYAGEEYYAALVKEFLSDSRFRNLEIAMNAQDAEEAYTAGRSLLERARNLGLTPLVQPLSLFVDRLRTHEWQGASALYGELRKQADTLRNLDSSV